MSSGDTLMTLGPDMFTGQSGAYPTRDLRIDDGNNPHVVLDFPDDETVRAVSKTLVMPQHYGGGGVTLYFHVMFSTDTNTGHTAEIDAAFENGASQDADVDGFAAANTTTVAPNGTCGVETEATIAFTDGADMDSVGAGDPFRVYFERDHDGSDDASGDMEFKSLELRES